MKPNISFEDFTKLEIRIAKIVRVEEVEDTDKLYKITLDVGELGEKVVAAGLKPFYKSEEMEGKLVPYLANLEPKEIRGVMSQGMIMAAGEKEASLIHPDKDLKPGEVVR
jgi:methionyl-tRNA synthetase